MTNTSAPLQLLRLPEVVSRTGLGRSTVWALIARGQFPKQVKLSARSSAWVAAEVDQWAANRITERDQMAA